MSDLTSLALQVLATAVCAIGIDWAIQFRIQLMYSAASIGGGPRPYRLGPAHKLLLMALYVALLNWALFAHANPTFAFIAGGTLFVLYVADATFLAVQMMKEKSDAA